MNSSVKKLTVKTLLLASLTFGVTPISMAADMDVSQVHVTGSSQRMVDPSYAVLSLGITTDNANVTTAKITNDRIMSDLLSKLSELGIMKKDVYTSNMNVSPNYNYMDNRRTTSGYTVSNQVTVRINDLNNVGKAIDAAVSSGANEINSLSFKNDVSGQLNDQLTTEAIKNGRHQAEIMAAALGRTLGPVKSVTISTPQTNNINDNIMYAKSGGATNLSSFTPVENGSLVVSKDADIIYYLQ